MIAKTRLKPPANRAENLSVSTYEGSLKVAATADVVEARFEVDSDTLRVVAGRQELGRWFLSDINVENRSDGIHIDLQGESIVVNVGNQEEFAAAIGPAAPPEKRRHRRRPKTRPARKAEKRAAGKPERRVIDEPETPPAREPEASPVPEPAEPVSLGAAEPISHEPERRVLPQPKNRIDWGRWLRAIPELFESENWERWLNDRTIRWRITAAAVLIFALLALFATSTLGMIMVLVGMVTLIVAALAMSEDLSAYRIIPGGISETMLVIVGAGVIAGGALLIIVG